jgi:hypothetical protein
MEYFEKMGAFVANLWRKYNYNEEYFPEVANTVLSQMPPHENTTFEKIVQYALTTESLPQQPDPRVEFAQPRLTVFLGREFRIEVLFWTGATPAVHQHAFSGAFHVMQGASIHIAWDFDFQKRVSSHLHYGKIALRKAELLKLGDIRAIHAGDQFIHTTFHLDIPTVSVVVRTIRESDQWPPYAYLPPSIRYNGYDEMPVLKRKCEILAMLVASGRLEEHDSMLRDLFATSDTFAVFHYLYQANFLRDKAAFEHLLRTAAEHHQGLVSEMVPALFNLRRQAELVKIRNKVTDDQDLRFFLALLINVSHRETLLSLLRQRYAQEDPVSKFIAFFKQLSDADLLGEKFSDPWLLMLQCLLQGLTTRDQIETAFVDRYGEAQVQSQRNKLGNLAVTIGQFWLLRPLLEFEGAFQPMIERLSVAAGSGRINQELIRG